MAIRRPPTTFSDTISTGDIADDAITGGKLANDIAISTTGNITTTGSGALSIAGTSTFTGLMTANGDIDVDDNKKVKQKGAFLQSSTHQAMMLGIG